MTKRKRTPAEGGQPPEAPALLTSALPPLPEGVEAVGESYEEGGFHFQPLADGRLVAYRTLPGIAGWVFWPLSESLPMGTEQIADFGIPEPPGGEYKDVFAVLGAGPALRASTVEGDFHWDEKVEEWIMEPKPPTPQASAQTFGPETPPAERPDSEVSVRIQRIRAARRGG